MKKIYSRYFIAILLVLTTALLSGPLSERFLYAWSIKDIDLRANLIANSLSESVVEELPNKNSQKVSRYFKRLVKDERLQAIAFCREGGMLTNASSSSFSSYYNCTPKGSSKNTDKGRRASSSSLHYYINNIDIFDKDKGDKIGQLIMVHDLAYVAARVNKTKILFYTISFSALVFGGILILILNKFDGWLTRKKSEKEFVVDESRKLAAERNLEKCVTVIIPALNEEKRIADVVAYALSDPATAEVIVIDDSSIDNTVALAVQAGAKVYTSSMLGKGASMQDGVGFAAYDLIAFLDGDLAGLRSNIISDLCKPLVREDADFVKAKFGRGGGRVTELTAKPMLKIFFPELAKFSQPLGGIIAARKPLLKSFSFEDGYGVDIALLIDAHLAGAKLAEVDIGSLEHDSQPLHDLASMVNDVGSVIFGRARSVGRLHVEQVAAMYEAQRQVGAGLEYILTRRKGRGKLLLLDMDGTIIQSRFAVELSKVIGHEKELMSQLDKHGNGDAATRTEKIADIFRYTHRKKFEQVARTLEIRPGVIEFVNQMRRRGYMVGIVSDSYFVAADIIRRRIFADFALAHTIQFENDVCTGGVRINPAFLSTQPSSVDEICKSNALKKFKSELEPDLVTDTWVVGDNLNDLELMRLADRAFVIEPKSPVFNNEPGITQISSFNELLGLLPDY